MNFIKLPLYIIIAGALMISCKNDIKLPDVNGKKLKEIKANVIITEDGTSITLQEDSITKIYYLVRHAEKDTFNKVDPILTESGFNRATKIADIMRGTRVDAIYSTMKLRALYTVDSLADIKMMSVKPYDDKGLKQLLDDVKSSTDYNRIFIVGHSNTIPAITNTLAKRDVFTKTFDESEYDNFIVIVEKKSGNTDVYTMKY
ncbi:MAG: histidine phosphatase family protein [Saprospiraceae bacterium]|nr:histidine phosphatase family protein [Saprospiraceae bacterium]